MAYFTDVDEVGNVRTCPTCGHCDRPGKGRLNRISAVLNEIVDRRFYEARCLCPRCNSIWDEIYDDLTGEYDNIMVRREN